MAFGQVNVPGVSGLDSFTEEEITELAAEVAEKVLPQEGSVGQVLVKTEDGTEWRDASEGSADTPGRYVLEFGEGDWVLNDDQESVSLTCGANTHGLQTGRLLVQVWHGAAAPYLTNDLAVINTSITVDGEGNITLDYPEETGYAGLIVIMG